MKWSLLLVFLLGCNPIKQIEPKVGECVLGTGMAVWKLVKEDSGKYLFASYPLQEDSPAIVIEDPRTFKKVECP